MVTILKSLEEFQKISTLCMGQELVLIPLFKDARAHPGAAGLCLWVIHLLQTNETYILPVDHSEALSLPASVSILTETAKLIWTPDKKAAAYHTDTTDWNDINTLEYLGSESIVSFESFYTLLIKQFHSKFHNKLNVNSIIPLYQWAETFDAYVNHLRLILTKRNTLDNAYTFINTKSLPVFHAIEKSGLYVDVEKFPLKSKRFVQDSLTFSQYNLYTTTGRPSNKFGGINYAALNKSDGTRAMFQSRFKENGTLVSFDYEAYHLRLLANLMKYPLPTTSVHQYFGELYFDTATLTKEQYEESKQLTFQQLYGERECTIPFFQKVTEFRKQLFEEFTKHGEIRSPISSKVIKINDVWNPTETKVFNYLVQLLETETSILTLEKLIDAYKLKHSKLILYTYDSILIDFCKDDGAELIRESAEILQNGGKYPVRMYVGLNYHEMEDRSYLLEK